MNILSYFHAQLNEKKVRRAYKQRLQKLRLQFPIFCKVHAVKSADHQGALAQSRAGDGLQLVHVPTEAYPFGVCVYSIPLNRLLGFLDAKLSEKLVYAFGEGFCRDGEIEEITGGPPYKYYGCNLRVLDTQELLNGEDLQHLHSDQ